MSQVKKARMKYINSFLRKRVKLGSGDVHIHLVIMDTERYLEFIILRNYLLNNNEEAINYSNLKKEIIVKGTTDRREYKAIKSPYVTELLNRAKAFYNKTN